MAVSIGKYFRIIGFDEHQTCSIVRCVKVSLYARTTENFFENFFDSQRNAKVSLIFLYPCALSRSNVCKSNVFVFFSELLYPEGSISPNSGISADILCKGRDYLVSSKLLNIIKENSPVISYAVVFRSK